jgi:hypothetical protein
MPIVAVALSSNGLTMSPHSLLGSTKRKWWHPRAHKNCSCIRGHRRNVLCCKQVLIWVSPNFYERGGTNREVAIVALSSNGLNISSCSLLLWVIDWRADYGRLYKKKTAASMSILEFLVYPWSRPQCVVL